MSIIPVWIVNLDHDKDLQSLLPAALKTIRIGLNSVSAKLKVDVHAPFTESEARAFGPSTFVVYVLRTKDARRALSIANWYAPGQTEEQLRRGWEGVGVNVMTGKKGVSFVEFALFAAWLSVPGKQHFEEVARLFGDRVLHELGHAMGEEDADSGIMFGTLRAQLSEDIPPRTKYGRDVADRMAQWLNGL